MTAWLRLMQIVADQIKGIGFFKYVLPVIVLVGAGVSIYWGYLGVVHQRTYFYANRLFGFGRQGFELTGHSAVLTGLFYLLVQLPLIVGGVGPLIYYLWKD